MGGPAVLWLVVFFLVPLVTMLSLSVQTCDSVTLACQLTWHFAEFPDVIREFSDTIVRSFVYAGAATVATLIVNFVETFNGIRAVQAFRRESRNDRLFGALNADYRDANAVAFRLHAVFIPGTALIGNVATVAVLPIAPMMRIAKPGKRGAARRF